MKLNIPARTIGRKLTGSFAVILALVIIVNGVSYMKVAIIEVTTHVPNNPGC